MLRRRQINRDPRGRATRLLSAFADAARWPVERAGWAIERGFLWPLRERLAGRRPSAQRAGAAALGAIALAAVLGGVLLLPRGGEPRQEVAAPTAVAVATPEPQPKAERPKGPVLKGATPSFDVGPGVGVSAATADAAAELNSGSAAPPQDSAEEADEPEEAATASTSSKKPVPAGPAAMKVARRFSEAFVFYEIGARPAQAKTVFGETAAPQLATALGERPPRQPAGAAVPKARVLNLVPGPRAGKAYTVSVSLLRLGLTTELRLELNKEDGEWVVTDVRG